LMIEKKLKIDNKIIKIISKFRMDQLLVR
jgi:hypothetical protein